MGIFKFKRGTEASRTSFTPSEGEVVYTTDQKKLFVGDGATVGGLQFAKAGTLVDEVSVVSSGTGYNVLSNGMVTYNFELGAFNTNQTKIFTLPIANTYGVLVVSSIAATVKVTALTTTTVSVMNFGGLAITTASLEMVVI